MRSAIRSVLGAIIYILGMNFVVAQEAADIHKVLPGESVVIDRHAVCRRVSNSGPHPIMAATGTPEEWSSGTSSFLMNLQSMEGVTVDNCVIDDGYIRSFALSNAHPGFPYGAPSCAQEDVSDYATPWNPGDGGACDVAGWNAKYSQSFGNGLDNICRVGIVGAHQPPSSYFHGFLKCFPND